MKVPNQKAAKQQRRASSILRELLMVVYAQNSSINLYGAVHNPITFS